MFDRLKFYRHPVREEDLSAHLDGRLSPDRARRLEEHLRSCDSCRRKLAELRALAAALREMPDAPVPRSFALTPEQVRGVRPVRPYAPAGRLYPVFRNAAAAALLLLFASVGADIFIESGGGRSELQEAEPQAAMVGAEKNVEMPAAESGAVAADEEDGAGQAFGESEAVPLPATAESTPLLVFSPTAWGTPAPGAGLTPPPYPVPTAPEAATTTLTPLPELALTAPEASPAVEAARSAAVPEEEEGRLWLRALEGVLAASALGLLAVALFLRRRLRRAKTLS